MVNTVRLLFGLAPAEIANVDHWTSAKIVHEGRPHSPVGSLYIGNAVVTIGNSRGVEIAVRATIMYTEGHERIAVRLPWSRFRGFMFSKYWVFIDRAGHRMHGPHYDGRQFNRLLHYMQAGADRSET